VRAVILAAAVALLSVPARAQTCGKPDLLSTAPPDGAAGVPTGVPLHAFYAAAALYQSEPILLDMPDGTQRALVGNFDPAEGRLTLSPSEPLAVLTTYTVWWPELRGTTSGGKGLGRKITFTTGAAADTTPPSFAGATALAWDWVRETDDCTDKIEDRLTFDVSLGEASDDGGRDSLTLILSQTQGPNLPAGPRQVYLGPLPSPEKPARVSLAVDGAVGRICFAALVRDLTDKISGGGDSESCAKTTQPPFFNGCSFAPSSHDGTGTALGALGLLLLLERRRRHRRGHAR
jgi:MYXO-CTERM domain-containing protein